MTFDVENESNGKRLDVFLSERLQGECTRSFVKNLIDSGQVLLNKKTPQKSGVKLQTGDKIEIELPEKEPVDVLPENIPIDIVYEDGDLLVINKKQGMIVHPAGKIRSGTLVNALLFHVKDLSGINGKIRPGIVHRIDKDTSGLLVVAKNDYAHLNLQKQIQEKTCKREYVAVTYGRFKDNEGEIQTWLDRSKKNYEKYVVSPMGQGKFAHTIYKVADYNNGVSLVLFELKTGRTHQIRVHSSYLGHPIVGDKLYGKEEAGIAGQLLHAYRITFKHPRTNKEMSFCCDLPDYFRSYLEKKELKFDENMALNWGK